MDLNIVCQIVINIANIPLKGETGFKALRNYISKTLSISDKKCVLDNVVCSFSAWPIPSYCPSRDIPILNVNPSSYHTSPPPVCKSRGRQKEAPIRSSLGRPSAPSTTCCACILAVYNDMIITNYA